MVHLILINNKQNHLNLSIGNIFKEEFIKMIEQISIL